MVGLTLALLLSAEPSGLAPPPSSPPQASPITGGPYTRRALIPLAIAGALAVGGGVFLGISIAQTDSARGLAGERLDALLSSATSNRVGGVMLLVSGALTAAIAALLFQYEPTPGLTLSVGPTPGGALVSFSSAWSVP